MSTGRTINVSNTTQLTNALRQARGGETIALAPGTYSFVNIRDFNPGSQVTIRSANPNNDAVIESLRLNNSSNIRFLDLDVGRPLNAGEREWNFAAMVFNVRSVTFAEINFRGSLDGNANNDMSAIRINGSQNVAILDSTFQQQNRAALFESTDGIVFANNRVTEVREGLNFQAVSKVLIEDNVFQKLTPNRAVGDHTDAIQFWTTNANRGSSSITIRDNAFLLGAKESEGAQGILISSQTAGLRHSDILIQNNVYFGSSVHGISVHGSDKVMIDNNTVLTAPNMANQGRAPITAAIRTTDTRDLTITDNVTSNIQSQTGTNTVTRNNTMVAQGAGVRGLSLTDLFAPANDLLAANTQNMFVSRNGSGFRGGATWGPQVGTPDTIRWDALQTGILH